MFNIRVYCKFLGNFNSEEIQNFADDHTKKIGIFHNEFNGKILLCIGICVENNLFSKKTANYLLSELEKDKNFFKTIIDKVGYELFKEEFYKILTSDVKYDDIEARIVKANLKHYINNFTEGSEEDAIKGLYNKCYEAVSIISFTIHRKENDTKLIYKIEESPTLFAFFDSSFLVKHKINKQIFFKKASAIENRETFTKYISEILKHTFTFYLMVLWPFD